MTTVATAPDERGHSIVEILDRTCEAAGPERASVRETVQSLGHISHGALILLPALLVVTPLSGIPGFSSVAGICIAMISAQGLFSRDRLWLPEWLLRREVASDKLRKALSWLRGPAQFADRHTRRRMLVLVRPPARAVLLSACMICGLAMPLLELVPFSSSILAAAVAFFATALVTQDGMLAAAGLLFVIATAAVVLVAVA